MTFPEIVNEVKRRGLTFHNVGNVVYEIRDRGVTIWSGALAEVGAFLDEWDMMVI